MLQIFSDKHIETCVIGSPLFSR